MLHQFFGTNFILLVVSLDWWSLLIGFFFLLLYCCSWTSPPIIPCVPSILPPLLPHRFSPFSSLLSFLSSSSSFCCPIKNFLFGFGTIRSLISGTLGHLNLLFPIHLSQTFLFFLFLRQMSSTSRPPPANSSSIPLVDSPSANLTVKHLHKSN